MQLPNAREILPGIWRSASIDECDVSGFAEVIDLRNEAGVHCTLHVPLELGLEGDERFEAMKRETQLSTPGYYEGFCLAWPERVISAVHSVESAPRLTLFHCAAGWDRTGLIAALMLARAGRTRESIVEDYALSRANASDGVLGKRDAVGEWRAPFEKWLGSEIFGRLVESD